MSALWNYEENREIKKLKKDVISNKNILRNNVLKNCGGYLLYFPDANTAR
jgi:hypothetical protein